MGLSHYFLVTREPLTAVFGCICSNEFFIFNYGVTIFRFKVELMLPLTVCWATEYFSLLLLWIWLELIYLKFLEKLRALSPLSKDRNCLKVCSKSGSSSCFCWIYLLSVCMCFDYESDLDLSSYFIVLLKSLEARST